jgi:hypothetical protein
MDGVRKLAHARFAKAFAFDFLKEQRAQHFPALPPMRSPARSTLVFLYCSQQGNFGNIAVSHPSK